MAINLPIAPERLEKKTMFQRFTGTESSENAFARTKNLVITGQFDKYMVGQICTECDLDIPVVFRQRWIDLFREIMYCLLEDGVIDATEKSFAKEYISTFKLSKSDIDDAIQRSARDLYVEKLMLLVGPNGLNKKQHAELEKYAHQIGLKDMPSAYNESVGLILKTHVCDILDDDLLTPDETTRFNLLCESLHVSPSFDPIIQQRIDAAKSRWRLLTDSLEAIAVSDLRLGTDETAYHDEFGEWYETRKINIGGQSVDQYKLIHAGRIILTDSRLLLIAESGSNKSLKWKSLLAVERDARSQVELTKERGKSPIIKYFDCGDTPSNGPLIACRLFQENE